MLLRPALAVLKKYGGKLPLLSNVKYNQYLKVVAQTATFDSHATDSGQYTLNEEQNKIFNDACQDIARQIGSFHYA